MKPMHQMLGAAIGALSLALSVSFAHASGFVITRHIDAPEPGHAVLGPIELRQHQTDATIRDQVAVTTIEQVFHNPTSHRLEGTYCFPLPAGAQIDRFTLFIDGKETEAELLPAEKARDIYESIVRRMKDPALLEYMGQSLFKVRIFPFEPNGERRIRLQYTEILPQDNSIVGYTLPLHRDNAHRADDTTTAIRVKVDSAHPIGAIYSPTHDVEITRESVTSALVGFEHTGTNDEDFQLYFSRDPSGHDIGLTLMSHRPTTSDEDGYFLMLLSPSAQLETQLDDERVIEKDVVFVLDTSGSMSGGKLDQARRALRFCLDNLNDGDRFDIIRFSTEAEPLFDALKPADDEHRTAAAEFLDTLKPTGGTAINDALSKAVAARAADRSDDRPYFVIFLTDGRPTVGTTQTDSILSNLDSSMGDDLVRVFAFGIGHDVNAHLLDQVAERTRAVSQYVLPEEDIEIKVSNFYARVSDPILANLDLSFGDAVHASKMYPRDLPDLFRGDQLVILGRYTGDGDAAITLKGSVNGRRHSLTYESTFASGDTQHEYIPRLWATRRIGYLLDQVRLHGENHELRDEIARLARQYGIVTPYTSYLILEDEAHRNVPMARRTLQSLEAAPDGVAAPPASRDAIVEQFDRMQGEAAGELAVNTARSNQAMRDASHAGAMRMIVDHARRGARKDLPDQQARLVHGRAFFQNGNVWIDSQVQAAPKDAKRVQIAFDSDAYYDLLSANPEAAPWLSISRNVQVLLDETIYEITDPADAG